MTSGGLAISSAIWLAKRDRQRRQDREDEDDEARPAAPPPCPIRNRSSRVVSVQQMSEDEPRARRQQDVGEA